MLLGLMQVNAGAKTSFFPLHISHTPYTGPRWRNIHGIFRFESIEIIKKIKTRKRTKKKDKQIEALIEIKKTRKKKQWAPPHEVPIVHKAPGALSIQSQLVPCVVSISHLLIRFLLPSVFLIPPPFFSFSFASVSFFHGDIISLISTQFIRFLENGLPPPVPAPLIDSTWVFEHLPKHLH